MFSAQILTYRSIWQGKKGMGTNRSFLFFLGKEDTGIGKGARWYGWEVWILLSVLQKFEQMASLGLKIKSEYARMNFSGMHGELLFYY